MSQWAYISVLILLLSNVIVVNIAGLLKVESCVRESVKRNFFLAALHSMWDLNSLTRD